MNHFQRLLTKLKRVGTFLILHARSLLHSRELTLTQDNLNNIGDNDLIVFCVLKNEAHRLEYFLEFYRKKGADHFIFVDNDSTDTFKDVVRAHRDVSVFHTSASYRDSNFGVYWLNYLLSKYGRGHWCLTCDPDEFLVYPKDDTRNLKELTGYLDAKGTVSFYTLLVDMYSKCPVEEAYYTPGTDPLGTCPFFDRTGYNKSDWKYFSATSATGGVRLRVFFNSCPELAPAINKTPLVKWQRKFVYALSTHVARPNFININCDKDHITGALLHFKFISDIQSKVEEEMLAKQHWDDSFEYRKYSEILRTGTKLYDKSISIKFQDWRSLVECGLINMGDW